MDELTNHGDISTGGKSLHERLCTGFGDCTKVVDEISLGHTHTGIKKGQSTLFLVWGDSNVELFLRIELFWVGESGISDLVESIGRVGDQFSEENFLVGVESVDDEVEKLGDFGLWVHGLISTDA